MFAITSHSDVLTCVEQSQNQELSRGVSDIDAADIDASLGGDEEAYARLVRRYEPLIAAQMWRFTRDRRVLDELVQDVFVEVYQSLRNFRGKAPFLHWVRKIATRVGYRYWKQKGREREREAVLTDYRLDANPTIDRLEPSEAGEYVYHLLDQLDPKDRLVLMLLYFEECNTREIAERVGWSRSLVKVRAYRARQKLRALLEDAGYGGKKR